MIDLVGIIGYYSLVSVTLNAFELPLPDGEKLPFDITLALTSPPPPPPFFFFSLRGASRLKNLTPVFEGIGAIAGNTELAAILRDTHPAQAPGSFLRMRSELASRRRSRRLDAFHRAGKAQHWPLTDVEQAAHEDN